MVLKTYFSKLPPNLKRLLFVNHSDIMQNQCEFENYNLHVIIVHVYDQSMQNECNNRT